VLICHLSFYWVCLHIEKARKQCLKHRESTKWIFYFYCELTQFNHGCTTLMP
jgi:hypothetical protein